MTDDPTQDNGTNAGAHPVPTNDIPAGDAFIEAYMTTTLNASLTSGGTPADLLKTNGSTGEARNG